MRMLQLVGNTLTCADSGQSVKLACKHSPVFLRLLFSYTRDDKVLSANRLSSAIQKKQATFTLHRNQVLRMLNDIGKAFSALAIKVTVCPEKSHRSTGPWFLSGAEEVVLSSHESVAVPNTQSCYFNWGEDWQSIPHRLYEFISIILNADILAHAGYVREVPEHLSGCESYPMKPCLRGFISLHRAKFLAKQGDFTSAKTLAISVAAEAEQSGDRQLISSAYFLLAYLDYVKAPALNYSALLTTMAKPQPFHHADEQTLMYWHNLRALLLRRKALANPDEALVCHQQALYHFEACLFAAIKMNNTICTVDFMVNLALHLQELLPLHLTKIEDVYHWYYLAINYIDKLGIGAYSVWDRIFFTEFYLKYTDEILASPIMRPVLETDLSPQNSTFYEDTLAKINHSGDARQKVIFLFLYLRFARRQGRKELVNTLVLHTQKELNKQAQHFADGLYAEGYGEDIDSLVTEKSK